jgi:2-polyprenyl-6-methoxyphenol hydroxylase-like FAD-dependent oxidoreductase
VLPHQGSGAYTAIEDAEALGAFLQHASRADAPGALRHAFAARFRRASAFQALSRAHDIYNAPRAEEAALFERWNYPGVEQWVREHPDMVLPVEDSS